MYVIVTLLLAWGIYALNMRAVAKELVPPRKELAQPAEPAGRRCPLIEQPPERLSRLRRFVSVLVLLGALAALELPLLFSSARRRWSTQSAVSLLGRPLGGRQTGGQNRGGVVYARLARRDRRRGHRGLQLTDLRGQVAETFAEDLVEVLTRMGHPPQDTVTLVVQSPTTSETRTLEDVPMTEANRWAIYEAAR